MAKLRLLRGCACLASNTLRALSRATSRAPSGLGVAGARAEGGAIGGGDGGEGGATAGRGGGTGLLCAAWARNCSSSASRLLGSSGKVGWSAARGDRDGEREGAAVSGAAASCRGSGSRARLPCGWAATSVPDSLSEPCAEIFCFCCSALRSASISRLTADPSCLCRSAFAVGQGCCRRSWRRAIAGQIRDSRPIRWGRE